MRFGFAQIPREHQSKHVDLVKTGEELGFDLAWFTDQTFYADPYVLAGLALEATERIAVGIGVTNAYTRHPAMTARAAATMNEVGPGRVHLGIGAGNRQELLEPLGIHASRDSARCRETVEIIRRLLTGERTDYEGDHYRVHDVSLQTTAAPEIPLYIGGRGPRILQSAGELADGAIIGGLSTPAGMSYAKDQISAGARKAKRDLEDLEVVCWITCYLTDNPSAKREAIKPWIAHFIGEAPQGVLDAVGLSDETVRAIKSSYAEGGSNAAAPHVTDDCIDQFSMVTEPDEGAERIEALSRAGVTQFILLLPTGSVDEHRVQLKEFADHIFPRFR